MKRILIPVTLFFVSSLLCGCIQPSTTQENSTLNNDTNYSALPLSPVNYWIQINPISDHPIGDVFIISGTTPLPAGTKLYLKIAPEVPEANLPTKCANASQDAYEYCMNMVSGTTIVDTNYPYNSWNFTVNTSNLHPVHENAQWNYLFDVSIDGAPDSGIQNGITAFNIIPTITTPNATCVPMSMSTEPLVFDETQNNSVICLNMSNNFTVRLPDFIRTNGQWNLATSPGLKITNVHQEWFYFNGESAPIGVGNMGNVVWDISIMKTGKQTIQGVLTNPSMPPEWGPIRTFNLTILVK